MKVSNIHQRENGIQIKLTVLFFIDLFATTWIERVDISHPPKADEKRKFTKIDLSANVDPKSSLLERRAEITKELLKHVTKEELLASRLELWNNLKPTL